MENDAVAIELARSMATEYGDHILDLLTSVCPKRVAVAELLLALVGWSTIDLEEAMGDDLRVATHGN